MTLKATQSQNAGVLSLIPKRFTMVHKGGQSKEN